MKKILVLALLISGCVAQDPVIVAGRSLLATQKTIVNVHEAFRAPCKQGMVPPDVCREVDRLTMEAAPAYDAAVSALLLTGDTSKQAAFELMAASLLTLAVRYSVEVAR